MEMTASSAKTRSLTLVLKTATPQFRLIFCSYDIEFKSRGKEATLPHSFSRTGYAPLTLHSTLIPTVQASQWNNNQYRNYMELKIYFCFRRKKAAEGEKREKKSPKVTAPPKVVRGRGQNRWSVSV